MPGGGELVGREPDSLTRGATITKPSLPGCVNGLQS
jgi:hypothetical protein